MSLAAFGIFLIGSAELRSAFRSKSRRPQFSLGLLAHRGALVDSSPRRGWVLDRNKASGWSPPPPIPGLVLGADQLRRNVDERLSGVSRTSSLSSRAALEREGFVRVKLNRMASGHLRLAARFDRKEISLVLDTGSSRTEFDSERLATLGLGLPTLVPRGDTNEFTDSVASGFVGYLELGSIQTRELQIGICDLRERNRILLEHYGEPPVDGILGADVLEPHMAVIDYKVYEVYLRGRGMPE